MSGCGGRDLQRAVERLEPRQHPTEAKNGVLTISGAAAMRGASEHFDLHPRESLVANGDRKVGRLGDDSTVGGPLRGQRFGANARMLLVDDGRDDEAAGVESALGDRRARRRSSRRRRPSCPARRDRTVDRLARPGERILHPGHADGVRVSAEHERAAATFAVDDADHVRTPGRDVLDRHVETDAPHLDGDRVGDVAPLARRARESDSPS